MQIFFPKRLVETLKKWSPPRQVTFKCPPRVFHPSQNDCTVQPAKHFIKFDLIAQGNLNSFNQS